ncbi:MAG: Flp1 family type IVb pilin [Oscillospiraceae bacterium]
MEKVMFKVWVKAQMAKQSAKDKLASAKRAFCEEDGEGAGIIVAIILIVIAVALAIIFRDWISGFVAGLFGQVNDSADFGDMSKAKEAADKVANSVGQNTETAAEGGAAALFLLLF